MEIWRERATKTHHPFDTPRIVHQTNILSLALISADECRKSTRANFKWPLFFGARRHKLLKLDHHNTHAAWEIRVGGAFFRSLFSLYVMARGEWNSLFLDSSAISGGRAVIKWVFKRGLVRRGPLFGAGQVLWRRRSDRRLASAQRWLPAWLTDWLSIMPVGRSAGKRRRQPASAECILSLSLWKDVPPWAAQIIKVKREKRRVESFVARFCCFPAVSQTKIKTSTAAGWPCVPSPRHSARGVRAHCCVGLRAGASAGSLYGQRCADARSRPGTGQPRRSGQGDKTQQSLKGTLVFKKNILRKSSFK